MDIKIKDGNYVITIPIASQPKETAKMMLTANSGGWQTLQVGDKQFMANVMIGYRK
jgi:hypothetical protein